MLWSFAIFVSECTLLAVSEAGPALTSLLNGMRHLQDPAEIWGITNHITISKSCACLDGLSPSVNRTIVDDLDLAFHPNDSTGNLNLPQLSRSFPEGRKCRGKITSICQEGSKNHESFRCAVRFGDLGVAAPSVSMFSYMFSIFHACSPFWPNISSC